MTYFVSKPAGYTPLYTEPSNRSRKVIDLNPFAIVEIAHGDGEYRFASSVVGGKAFTGWIERKLIEPYVVNLPENIVDLSAIQTESASDADQYVIWKGKRQVNMCGEICCAYLLGVSLAEVLTRWEHKEPNIFKRIFGSGIAGGTYNTDLQTIFRSFDKASDVFSGKQFPYWTPTIVDLLKGAIIGVRLNTQTGRLNGSGIGHWVVIYDIQRERTGGIVTIFDPYMHNGLMQYSYHEFIASARQPFGVRLI